MKRNFLFVGLLSVAFLVVGCQPKASNEEANQKQEETVVQTKVVDYHGTYEGTLPCADCSGVKIVVVLNQDSTYEINSTFLDKDKKEKEEGSFVWNETDSTLTLVSNHNDTISFFAAEGELVMLGANGNLPEGELADLYVLKKK